MNEKLSLDIADPRHLPDVLRAAAEAYMQSALDLPVYHGDPSAGKVWRDFATILERAARSCDAALEKRGLI